MIEESKISIDPRNSLMLKVPEPIVSAKQPWHDDALDRAQIAAELTNLLKDQSAPFVISIHGNWGTGKTFLLKRWQKELENQGFRAIYFNAWEDDFCDDPILSLLGQLSEHFKGSNFHSIVESIVKVAKPLLLKNVLGVLSKTTGLSLDIEPHEQRDYLKEYLDHRATKDELIRRLQELSQSVAAETHHPLVFIIDELDRCRPTFAIELLERVKHIFGIPDMAFVCGINRDELCSSLQSIYGEIDADVYLRRFFDMEFTLPAVDSENFCRHLFEKFGLNEFFRSLSGGGPGSDIHQRDFSLLSKHFPKLWGGLGLSLRDIDYCVRLVALVGKNVSTGSEMYPALLGLLIPLKFKNPTLYRQFIQGNCLGSDVMNYIDGVLPLQDSDDAVLDTIEAYLYLSDKRYDTQGIERSSALAQLDLLLNGSELTYPNYLSEKTQRSDKIRIKKLDTRMSQITPFTFPSDVIDHLAGLIDLHQSLLRR